MVIRIPVEFDADASSLESDLNRSTKSATSRVSGLLATGLKRGAQAAGTGIVAVLGTSLVKGFSRLNAIDQAEAKLRGLGYTARDIEGVMSSANKAVTGTAFGLADAVTASASALAAGVKPGRDLTRTLSLIGDAATIAGTDYNEMGAIFNKVAATGKVQGEVIAQLGERGIPILQLLGKQMGVSAAEVAKLASKGAVDFETFQKAMEAGLGGAAQESGKTFSGALANVGAALGRLGAAAIGPIFERLPALLGRIQTGVNSLIPYVSQAADAFSSMLSSVGSGGGLSSAVSSITAAVQPLAKSMLATGKVIFDFFRDLAPTVSKVAQQIGSALGPAFSAIADAVANKLLPAFNKLVPILRPVVKVLLQVFGGAVAGAIKGFQKLIVGTIDVIAGLVDFVVALVTGDWAGAWEAFKQIVSGALQAILGAIQVWWNVGILGVFRQGVALIRSLWTGAWNAIKAAPGAIMKGISSLVSKGLSAVGKLFANAAKAYIGVWRRILSSILDIVRNGLKVMRSAFGGALAAIRGVVTQAFNGIRNSVRSGVSNIVESVKRVPGQIIQLGGRFLRAGRTIMSKMFEGIRNGIKNIGSLATDLASGFRDAIVDVFNDLIDKMNSAIPDKLGWGKFAINIPNNPIPHLAKGTDFFQGGLAMVGERGPELVQLPRGAQVFTAGETKSLLRQSGQVSPAVSGGGDVILNQNYFGPSTSGGRLREMDWTLRYAVRGDLDATRGLAS